MADRLDTIRAALLGSPEALGEALLGPPNKALSSKRELRWGSKGSLALVIVGPKRGAWHSHEDLQGGGLLDLVMHARGCGFEDAVEWAAGWAGADGLARAAMQTPRPTRTAQPDPEAEAERLKSQRKAQGLWCEGVPIAGTPAAFYLVNERGIPVPDRGWPEAVRFHPRRGALMVAATSPGGDVEAVQLVHLDQLGAKIGEEERARRKLAAVKATYGVGTGHLVRLPGAAEGPLMIAEGPETGLTAWAAAGHETWIALGSMAKASLPAGRRVVACRDDDPKHSPADKALKTALAGWGAAGVFVTCATPWPVRRFDRSDLNDVARTEGMIAARERIERALSTAGVRPRRVPVREARVKADAAVGVFFAAALDHDADLTAAEGARAPVHGIRLDVGGGKSVAARRHAAATLAAMRSRATPDKRTVAFAVPAHKLADEQAGAFRGLAEARAAGLRAATWRGREQPDPLAPGERMCRNLDAVRDAQEASLDPEKAACRRTMPNGDVQECPFYCSCGYQRQARTEADLWIVPHELLFTTKPAAIGTLCALVVDERAWQDGLDGVEGRPIALALDALGTDDQVPGVGSGPAEDSARLRDLRRQALAVFRQHDDGPVSRDAFQATGLTAASAREGKTLEYRRKVEGVMHPGMSPEERQGAKQLAAGNRTIRRLAMMWRGIEALLEADGPPVSGWIELRTVRTESGAVRELHLMGRREVRDGWKVSTLLMDANLDPALNRHHWPDLVMTADVAIETPHMRVRQVEDQAYAKSRLEPHAQPGSEEGRRRARRRAELHAVVAREARTHAPGQVLVVAQKAVEDAFGQLPPLPVTVELAHHNDVAGRDQWKDAAGLILVGRTQPPPEAMSRMASALTGRHVPDPGQYEMADTTREMADGTFRPAEVERHPDATAEEIRWQSCEGELVQIIGRVRAVNRTTADPVDVLVLTNVPIPVPVAELVADAELAPTPADRMLATGGIAFENPADAAAAFPDLWPSRDAARKAFTRAKLGTNPLRESLKGECPTLLPRGLARVDYQRTGQGMSPMTAWCDPNLVPDPARLLERLLGAMAFVRVLTPPPRLAPNAPVVAPSFIRPVRLPTCPAGLPPPLIHPPPLGVWAFRRAGAAAIEAPGATGGLDPTDRPAGRSLELLGGMLWSHGWSSSDRHKGSGLQR